MTPVRAPSKQVMATTPLASVEGVTKRFSGGAHPAIDDLNLRVEPGRVTGLVGPDGAGKTTLMRLLAALMVPTEGRIVTCGHDTRGELSEIRRSVSYMPQRFGLYEDLTVAENLDLYADLGGVVGEERRQAIARLLGFTNLGPFTARLAGQLSGGMKQKLGLACALVHKPRLLLLDEPSVGVDPISRRELWQMVYDLVDEGIGVVWSTAYLDEAERCAWVLLLNQGQALYEGPPKELTNRVAGRTFLIQNAGDRRRSVLARAVQQPGVVDGVIQGSSVRLVMAEPKPPDVRPLGLEEQDVVAAPPRFEDAFVDLLGGGPKGGSALAAAMHPRAVDEHLAVDARNLSKMFGSFTAVEGVSFHIERGEIFGLLGPNGAGKSTTFKMMCGLLRPTAGTARVAGADLYRAGGSARRRLGYMAQKFSLYGDLSVRQNLDFFAGVYGLSRASAARPSTAWSRPSTWGPSSRSQRGRPAAGVQAATVAGLGDHARPGRAVSGRADLGGRSADAPRVLVAHQRDGRTRCDDPGDDALSRRGGVLRPHRAGVPGTHDCRGLARRAEGVGAHSRST